MVTSKLCLTSLVFYDFRFQKHVIKIQAGQSIHVIQMCVSGSSLAIIVYGSESLVRKAPCTGSAQCTLAMLKHRVQWYRNGVYVQRN